MSKKTELRVYNNAGLAVNGRTLDGYAATYEAYSKDLGGFREIIKRGAFAAAINPQMDVIANINHDENLILSRTGASLELQSDNVGLKFNLEVPATTYGNDLIVNLRAGNVKGCSFAFVVKRDKWTTDAAGYPLREIYEIGTLEDIALVTKPAYNDTSVALRALKSQSIDDATLMRLEQAKGL